MRKVLLLTLLLLTKLPSVASGTSLDEALNKTLNNNMALKASLYKSMASKHEVVSSAMAGVLPRVLYEFKVHNSGALQENSSSAVTLSQTLFNGTTMFRLDKARYQYAAQELAFALEKQKTLLKAINVYMEAMSAYEVNRLNESNLKVMMEQLESANKRFAVGEISRTDLAKAEAKFAEAKTDAISARGKLKTVEANYTRIVGEPPVDLKYPKKKLQIPSTLQEALDIAQRNNLSLLLSRNMYQASKRDAAMAVAKRFLPSLTIAASARTSPGGSFDRMSHRFDLTLSLPIFDSGVLGLMDIDKANKTRQHHMYSLHEAAREVEESVINAWEELQTAESFLKSAREAVKYNEVVCDAITQEASLNLKTTLDVLKIEQELLKAKVKLVNAKSKVIVNQYRLLALTGLFSVEG